MNILKTEKPQTIANILNGKQTLLVMKKAPKNAEGRWWYLYCSKSKPYLTFEYVSVDNTLRTDYPWGYQVVKKLRDDAYVRHERPLNGKVVARFWCDKVEEHTAGFSSDIGCQSTDLFVDEETEQILKKACLTNKELYKYLNANLLDEMDTDYKTFFAIHISKLEIFDRPKELSEFMLYCETHRKKLASWTNHKCSKCPYLIDGAGCCPKLTKAPQNYCYVEGEEV